MRPRHTSLLTQKPPPHPPGWVDSNSKTHHLQLFDLGRKHLASMRARAGGWVGVRACPPCHVAPRPRQHLNSKTTGHRTTTSLHRVRWCRPCCRHPARSNRLRARRRRQPELPACCFPFLSLPSDLQPRSPPHLRTPDAFPPPPEGGSTEPPRCPRAPQTVSSRGWRTAAYAYGPPLDSGHCRLRGCVLACPIGGSKEVVPDDEGQAVRRTDLNQKPDGSTCLSCQSTAYPRASVAFLTPIKKSRS